MLSSRIVLSLLGVFIAMMATLGWITLGEPGIGATIVDDRRAQYLICGLTLFSALAWFLTFFRPRGFRYLLCSRLLLSGLSCIFGACVTLILMGWSALSVARSVLVSDWQFWIYIAAASLASVVWTVIYHRGLVSARRGEVPRAQRS